MVMHREPIPIEMFEFTPCANCRDGFKVKHSRHHEIDGIDFIHLPPTIRQKIYVEKHSKLSVGPINVLVRPSHLSGMDVNTAIHRTRRRIVDRWHGTPECHSARIVAPIQIQALLWRNFGIMGRHTVGSGNAVFRSGIRFMRQAPIPVAAVAAPPNIHNFAGHDGSLSNGRRHACSRPARHCKISLCSKTIKELYSVSLSCGLEPCATHLKSSRSVI